MTLEKLYNYIDNKIQTEYNLTRKKDWLQNTMYFLGDSSKYLIYLNKTYTTHKYISVLVGEGPSKKSFKIEYGLVGDFGNFERWGEKLSKQYEISIDYKPHSSINLDELDLYKEQIWEYIKGMVDPHITSD